jgi:aminopeptidase N
MSPLLLASLATLVSLAAHARPDDECCGRGEAMSRADRKVTSVDGATGRDLLKYPPNPVVDYQHMSLKLDIADMDTPRMEAVQTLSLVPIGTSVTTLALDARLLEIKSVSVSRPANQGVTFKHDGATLALTFDPPLVVGQKAEIVTTYSIIDPTYGITWTPESPAWPGRPPQLHSQGQAETNSYWFPCHDSPNERLTTELTVTVPDGFVASSNGKLVNTSRASDTGRTTFHWLQDKPHVNYLVTLVVGKFDIETVARSGKDRIPMPVYVPPGRGTDIKGTYGNTPRMIDAFERRTGHAYPWDQYAQLVVWNFSAGGMENTSATTMYDTAILSPEGLADGDLDGLISHELAHQWFGDLITCKSWEHIWLNEGFATYFTSLWWEERDGRNGYDAGVLGYFDRVIALDKADAPYQAAMVSKDFRHPSDAFRKPANPYPKGAAILHMLRMKLGDEVFFRALAAYVEKYKFRLVETNDFRRELEAVSGESLEQFFAQWCYRPGVPHLDIACDWKSDTSELVITVEQKQTIDGYNPAFAFTLPVWVEGLSQVAEVEVADRKATASFRLGAEPGIVAIDPSLSVLAKTSIKQPLRRWLAQLDRGPTLLARVQAAQALADDASGLSAQALAKVASDLRAHDALRRAAVAALGKRAEHAAIAHLARARVEGRPVREALVEAAAEALSKNFEGPDTARLRDLIIRSAAKEESFKVRAAALRAIGTLKMLDQSSLLVVATETESQHDILRQAALEAIGNLDSAPGLPIAVRLAQPGTLSRTRPVAVATIAKLAAHDKPKALATLGMLLSDRERRTWQAAGEALVSMNDKAAVPLIQAVRDAARDPIDRERMQQWIEALSK